jgi:hypothetical protein
METEIQTVAEIDLSRPLKSENSFFLLMNAITEGRISNSAVDEAMKRISEYIERSQEFRLRRFFQRD